MQIRVDSETLRNTGSFRRHFVHLVGVAVAAVIWLGAAPAFAQSCPAGDGVDVEPAGAGIVGDLKLGTAAVFKAGSVTQSCTVSHTSGTIPVSGNPGDPVSGVLAPPTFTSCNIGSVSTNRTNGDWSLDVSCGGNATFHVPRAGAVARILTCTITVAPNGPIAVPATYVNPTSTDPHMLCINAQVPIGRSGFGCPNVSTATFSACYNIRTDSGGPVTAIQVPL